MDQKDELDKAIEEALVGNEIAAIDMFVLYFDELFLNNEFEKARAALRKINPEQLSPKILSSILMITKIAKTELGEDRIIFLEGAGIALMKIWKFDWIQTRNLIQKHA